MVKEIERMNLRSVALVFYYSGREPDSMRFLLARALLSRASTRSKGPIKIVVYRPPLIKNVVREVIFYFYFLI